MNKNTKIMIMGLLIAAICLPVSISKAQFQPPVNWQGLLWEVTYGVAENLDGDMLKIYAVSPEGSLNIAQLTRLTPLPDDLQSLELTFATPEPEEGDGNPLDSPTKIEFYISDETNKKSIWITLDIDEFTIRTKNRDNIESFKLVNAPNDIWFPVSESNKLVIGARPLDDGGYIDIIFNDDKLFTILDSSFAYETGSQGEILNSIFSGDSHIKLYTDVYAEFSTMEVFDEKMSFSYEANPPILSLNPTTETPVSEAFVLSGSFTDDDTLEEWIAVIDWGDGPSESTVPVNLGAFSLTHDYLSVGSYTGSIKIIDNGEQESDNLEFTAIITDSVPSITITLDPPSGLKVDVPVSFTGSVEATGPITDVVFDYGGGTGGGVTFDDTTFSGACTYTSPGSYTVTVTVYADGISETYSQVISISSDPISVEFNQDVLYLSEGSTQVFDLSLATINTYSTNPDYTWEITDPNGNPSIYIGESLSSPLLIDGTYSVSLTVAEYGESVTDYMEVIVTNIVSDVTLGADIYSVSVGVPVTFTSTVFDTGEDIAEITLEIRDSDGIIVVEYPTPADRYLYDDPSYYEKVYFDHGFADVGVYSVTSYATDDSGTYPSDPITVTVIGVPLTLDPIGARPDIIGEGKLVEFFSRIDGTDLGYTYDAYWYDDDPDQKPNLEPIAFNLGILVDNEFVFESNYPQDGSNMLYLVVLGEDNTRLTQNRPVEVDNLAPDVTIDTIPLVESSEPVVITGSFTDADDYDFSYIWKVNDILEDEGIIQPNDPMETELEYAFTSNGVYTIELWVTDNDDATGYASTDVNVLINNPPVIDEATYSPDEITQGDIVTFDVTANDPDGDEITYLWDFGGGDTSDWKSPERVYNTPGMKFVTIIVEDDRGATSEEWELSFFVSPEFADPQALKNQARVMLQSAIETYGGYEGETQGKKGKRHGAGLDVEKALTGIITYIDKSLVEKYWVDPLHVDPKKGDKVFNYEKQAVVKALALAKQVADIPELEGLDVILYDAIDLLVEADRILAEVVLLEAESVAPAERRYENYLASARRHYEKGVEYQENNKPVSAINSFRTSWKFSQKVLKKYPTP